MDNQYLRVNSNQIIVFIDSAIENYQHLVKGVIPQAEVIVLTSQQDGVEQITAALQGQVRFTSVHIVSHGAPGTLYLGNTELSLSTLDGYSEHLKAWFTPSLFLYGCNVAMGDAGEEFLTKLHCFTGAAIAASTTPIGNAALNGNWELDKNLGAVEFCPAFLPSVMESYSTVFEQSNPIVVGNTNYFTTYDNINGTELWRIDANGYPQQVQDINPGSASSNPRNFTVVDNILYFVATDNSNVSQLWKIDQNGYPKDLGVPGGLSNTSNITVLGDSLYFTASEGMNGTELWMMNSKTGNPINLNINYQNGASNPSNFTALGNSFYFTANDGYSGTELWRIVANSYPQQVKDINPGIGSSNPHNLTVIDNTLNFSADDGINGTQMWRIDPNTGTPKPLGI